MRLAILLTLNATALALLPAWVDVSNAGHWVVFWLAFVAVVWLAFRLDLLSKTSASAQYSDARPLPLKPQGPVLDLDPVDAAPLATETQPYALEPSRKHAAPRSIRPPSAPLQEDAP